MSDISRWSEQQLRNYIQQVQRDSPPRQGSVTHDTVNVQNTLYVNGQPIVGPNVFPNQFTATSGRGTPIGAFAGTDSMSRINDMYINAVGSAKYQFYQSIDKFMCNVDSSTVGLGVAVGSTIYLPAGTTLSAGGLFVTNQSTFSFSFTDCSLAVYGPWGGNAFTNTAPPLLTQTPNPAVDVFNATKPVYANGQTGLTEFALPSVYAPAGVYTVLMRSTGTGITKPTLLMFDPTLPSGGSTSSGSFFGEPVTQISILSGNSPWPSTLASSTITGFVPWMYLRGS